MAAKSVRRKLHLYSSSARINGKRNIVMRKKYGVCTVYGHILFAFVYFWIFRYNMISFEKKQSQAKQKKNSFTSSPLISSRWTSHNNFIDAIEKWTPFKNHLFKSPLPDSFASMPEKTATKKAALISIPLYINEMNKITMIECH